LCRRTSAQRLEIARAFKTAYGKDLIDNIKKEVSGKFEKVLVCLLKPLHQYYAEALYEAMEGIGTEEHVLIEVLCGLTNREVQLVTQTFRQLYGRNLEDALKNETSNCFKRVLVSLSTGNRDESMITNLASAQQDAQALRQAGVGRMGTDESEFNRILCLRNNAQIALIAQEYQKLSGNPLENDIKREFSGDIETAMVSILRCAINRPLFFAKRINNAVAGLGTDDNSLIRLVKFKNIFIKTLIKILKILDHYKKRN
jgi:annexin A7/11